LVKRTGSGKEFTIIDFAGDKDWAQGS